MLPGRPRIVCLCGSTRFAREIHAERRRLTALGAIVLAPEQVDGELTTPLRESLATLHLRRIDLADEVRVVSVNGHVGTATRREIAYAHEHGKPVTFAEAHAAAG